MVEELTPEEVEDLPEDAQIVDIRSPGEFERGHIPGAVNVPLTELPARIDGIEWGDYIVCACPIGQSSVQAANLIRSYEGVDDDAVVASMAGGYREWTGDLETGSGNAGEAET